MTRTHSATLIAEELVEIVRTSARAKARRQQSAAAKEVEWSSHFLLRALETRGPMRLSELADAVQADISTVSRQTAGLVKDGLLTRESDPSDGRVCVLVPTPAGIALTAARTRDRVDWFDRMLADWSAADLATFAGLLERFSADYRRVTGAWADAAAEPVGAGT